MKKQPVDDIRRVPLAKVFPNGYNPNKVALREMRLLYISIKKDGYTMPVVCFENKKDGTYEIVDGFHRYMVMKLNRDIYEENEGLLPISVIDKPIEERMASTIRHNRARGHHSLDGNAGVVAGMLEKGKDLAEISSELGFGEEELKRLIYTSRVAKRFADGEFSRSVVNGVKSNQNK